MYLVKILFNLNLVLILAHLGAQVAQSRPTNQDGLAALSRNTEQLSEATNYESPPAATSSQITTSQLQNDPIRAIHYHFDQEMEPFMQLHKFKTSQPFTSTDNGNNVTCNDGSPAGYYKRLNNHSKSWIIYLQGGGYCGSEESCQLRWRRSNHLMSSNYWPQTMSVEGILSSEPKDNPYLWNANHIYVPYCSSDSWTGLQEARAEQSSFAFMGSKIIEKVLDSLFDDLPRDSSLLEARFILLAGDSAGATGVIMNLDKVNRFVQERFNRLRTSCSSESPQFCEPKQAPIIRGLADSGWFLDNEPYDIYQQLQQSTSPGGGMPPAADSMTIGPSSTVVGAASNEAAAAVADCDKQRCSPLQSIKQAMQHWNGQVPASCAIKQANEPWRCYFAYRAYPTLRTPLFVVQWLYDEAQLMVDNIVRPGTISQWNYVNKLVSEMRASLENVTALFAPSCFSHSLIIKQSWNQININGFKLPHILNSWEEETLANQPSYNTLLRDQIQVQEQPPETGAQQQQQQYLLNNNQVAVPVNRESQLYDRPTMLQQQHGQHQPEVNQHQNHHHQLEMRSAIQRPYASSASGAAGPLGNNNGQSRSRSRKRKRNNNHNNQSVNSNRITANANRLSRSTTTMVDETTVVLNNNVPDVLLISAQRQPETGTDKFRLIDTCGWPQCNRDCPNLDLDFGLRSMMSY